MENYPGDIKAKSLPKKAFYFKENLAIIIIFCLCFAMAVSFVSCTGGPGDQLTSSEPEETSKPGETSTPQDEKPDEYFSKFDLNTSYGTDATVITLTKSSVEIKGSGAASDGGKINITEPGDYVVSGVMSDGQIIVNVKKIEKVHLIFTGVDITCKTSSPVWVKSADKVSITLAAGTKNYLSDSTRYVFDNPDNEPNACLFSKDDLTINGTGALIVTGRYNNGICSKDDLRIISGEITVNAKNNGLKGNDSVSIRGGKLTIKSSDDGIKTTNDSTPGKGFIYIRDGEISIISGDDALQAEQAIIVKGGEVTIKAGGKTINCPGTVDIAQGTVK